MKRRNFVKSTLVASAIPMTAAMGQDDLNKDVQQELYEIRTYEVKFGGNKKLLIDYLKNVLHPAMKRKGVNHFLLFNELGKSDPTKIWVLISYPGAAEYVNAQNLQTDKTFVSDSMEYDAIAPDQKIYNRYTSWLLHAFEGLAQMLNPIDQASLFELRIYEGHSEDAVRRKIKMFNKEEIDLFYKVGLHPVFFGDMLAGPYRPCLVYMLNFKDMEERDANWGKFVQHPDWNTMKVKEEYANSLSNIIKIFLQPL